MSNLTGKQKRFINEYLMDFNATQAAIRAGYSGKTAQQQSSRLLLNVVVQEIINSELDEVHRKQKKMLIRASDTAINALIEMVELGKGLAKVQAANSILDRSGHKAIDRLQADVKTEVINADEIKSKLFERFIKQMPKESGSTGD